MEGVEREREREREKERERERERENHTSGTSAQYGHMKHKSVSYSLYTFTKLCLNVCTNVQVI